MKRVRLTTAQAIVRFLMAQRAEIDGKELPLFGGVFAIFGHGNVAGLGEALFAAREVLPTLRAHNEQAMGHAAVAYAKAWRRRRLLACTTSIGPGATNLVTAAATAHVNRLPLLLLPGDVFASRRPDPVLQQIEHFGEPTISVNDCLRPVSRFWDRITRPEQLSESLPALLRVLLDPAECGPATLALPQDVQTEAFDYPDALFVPHVHRLRRPPPDGDQLARAVQLLAAAKRPLLIAGGGVQYSEAFAALAAFAAKHGVLVAETQAGKGALPWDHPNNVGALGVTGSSAANALAQKADIVLAVGTRLSDFTTASRALYEGTPLVCLNVAAFDAAKHGGVALVADARAGLEALSAALCSWCSEPDWSKQAAALVAEWNRAVDMATASAPEPPFTDAQVLGALGRVAASEDVVVCAAGGLPGELHKLWRAAGPGTYHLEYGYSCMGYEIAGGLGVKLAHPEQEVWVLVGDGSYLMLNSEIATSVALGKKLNIVVLDNRGFGCINRLQKSTGGAPFNNLLPDTAPKVDFAAHAASLGAHAEKVASLAGLEEAARRARASSGTSVIVIETDPHRGTQAGGAPWDVAVPEVSARPEVSEARRHYEKVFGAR